MRGSKNSRVSFKVNSAPGFYKKTNNNKEKNMTNVVKFEEQKQDIVALKELAQIATKSGNYKDMSEMTMLNIMLSAKDLGISPMKAINGGFYIVNGKISMSTSLMVDRIRKDGHSIIVPEHTAQKCVIIGKRKDNGDSIKVEFTMEDAAQAGLLGNPTWKKYPKAMLYNRAMASLARMLFPDITGNCYSEDEGEEIKNAPSYSKKTPVEEVSTIEIPQDSMEDYVKEIVAKIAMPDSRFLLAFLGRANELKGPSRTMREVVDGWVASPERFVKSYANFHVKQEAKELAEKMPEAINS